MSARRLPPQVRYPKAVLCVLTVAAVTGGIWGWAAPSRLSSQLTDFYGHPSESLRTLHELESARARNSRGAPNLAVIAPGDPETASLLMRRRLEGMPQVARIDRDILASRERDAFLLLGWLRRGIPEEDAAVGVAQALDGRPGVLVGGRALAKRQFSETVKADLWRGELLALPLLLILGLWFFRSVIAALLPVLIGSFAFLCTLGCLSLVAEIMPISLFSLSIASGLALGLSVDYSLLMVSRFRDGLESGQEGAVLVALRTAGKTVGLSAAAIAGLFACLLLIPVPFVRSIAVAGMLVASIAGIGALLILPAMFTLLGRRVDALPLRWGHRSRIEGRDREREGGWYPLARFVIRRPVRIAAASALLLLVMGLPALGMRFTAFDATSLPASSPLRTFSERLLEEFDHPLLDETRIAVHGDHQEALALIQKIERLAEESALAHPFPIPIRVGPRLYEMRLNPTISPYSGDVRGFVDDLRRMNAPISVGGSTAAYMDLVASLKQNLPTVLGAMLLSSFVFLLVATRSVVLPVKALIMNVLSLSAALGLLVVVFQGGWFEGLLGYSSQSALVVVLPVVLAVGAFGLLTDYGVFLLMRIREARSSGCSDREAIMIGVEKTGPIVTAAALLFSVAVGALLTSDIVLVKEAAMGIVTAVLLDAFVVRPFLVPSLMAILGRWNWWPHGVPSISKGVLPSRPPQS